MEEHRPTREELQKATKKKVPDVIAPGLELLFCGINPGLYSAAVGHHFARPGNRFWLSLQKSGFTQRLLSPGEAPLLLQCGIGITNLAGRATATADELSLTELQNGRRRLERKVRLYAPRRVAILGIGAYREAFGRPRATIGPQVEKIGPADLWVLPSPSGLNASYQIADLIRAFSALRESMNNKSCPKI